ncbi:MAG: hypothetical protein JST49_01675 [Bacteroidetes bacterium]|nr:hypothetical protein [Bacteroidota bacterium]
MGYEMILSLSTVGTRKINIQSLDKIRTNFVDLYYSNGKDKEYPNLLFEYQKKVKDAGHLQAYNYWILMKGDDQGFSNWLEGNKEAYEKFIAWFKDNTMVVDDEHKFHSSQYD